MAIHLTDCSKMSILTPTKQMFSYLTLNYIIGELRLRIDLLQNAKSIMTCQKSIQMTYPVIYLELNFNRVKTIFPSKVEDCV